MSRPQATDFPAYFSRYISQVDADSVHEAIKKYAGPLADFYTHLPEDKADYAYAPGKWTLKELLQHVIDAPKEFFRTAFCVLHEKTKHRSPLLMKTVMLITLSQVKEVLQISKKNFSP
jgi:hypothetical protein